MDAKAQAVEQYYRVQVETTSKDQVLLMVFDGLVQLVERVRIAIHEEQFEEKHERLKNGQQVMLELIDALDAGALDEKTFKDLRGLYFFVYRRFAEANFKNCTEALDDALKIIEHLRETWRMAVSEYRTTLASQTASVHVEESERPQLSVSG